jgi:hypothetical protein
MGFRPDRSTTDNMFTLRQIFEKCHEYNIDLYNIFVDYTQAFDFVNRNKIIESLMQHDIPSKIIRLIGLTHTNTIAQVKINNQFTENFSVETGAKQGDPLIYCSYRQCVKSDARKRKYIHKTEAMFCLCRRCTNNNKN